MVMPSDEAIIEAMPLGERPWRDMHHCTPFITRYNEVRIDDNGNTKPSSMEWYGSHIATSQVSAKENMVNISPTIFINISRNPSIVEHVFTGADCSP